MRYTREDAVDDLQMERDYPLCLMCRDKGFVKQYYPDPEVLEDNPCPNCDPDMRF